MPTSFTQLYATSAKTGIKGRNKSSRSGHYVLKVICIVIPILILAFVLFFCWNTFFAHNPQLMLDEISATETLNYASGQQQDKFSLQTILSELGIEAGTINLMNVNLKAIRQRLEEEPILKNIEIRKVFPNKLQISFAERTPVALLLCGQYTCYMDEEGVVLPLKCRNKKMNYSSPGVPRITAITNAAKLQSGVKTQDKHILSALKLISMVNQHVDFFNLKQIQLMETQDMMIARVSPLPHSNLFDNNAEIYFPSSDLDAAFKRLLQTVPQLNVPPIKSINVTLENNMPFTTKD